MDKDMIKFKTNAKLFFKLGRWNFNSRTRNNKQRTLRYLLFSLFNKSLQFKKQALPSKNYSTCKLINKSSTKWPFDYSR